MNSQADALGLDWTATDDQTAGRTQPLMPRATDATVFNKAKQRTRAHFALDIAACWCADQWMSQQLHVDPCTPGPLDGLQPALQGGL